MDKIIAACGNDCAFCPRHLPKKQEELSRTARLWMKIGYRDRVVSNGEISCTGCEGGNACRYKIVGCVGKKGVLNCGKCEEYPCAEIEKCFEATEGFAPACRAACTDEEYALLQKAFFEKKKNLDAEKNAAIAEED